jgi:CheY-like chemotaxis protein
LAEAAKTVAPGLPIVLVTALAGEAGRSGALFAAVLSKPIDRQSLVLQAALALLSKVDQTG